MKKNLAVSFFIVIFVSRNIKLMANKIKIIKRDAKGVLLSAYKGAEPVRMGWDEFNKNYTVEDRNWAVPNPEVMENVKKAYDLVGTAAATFIMAGGLTDKPFSNMKNLTGMAVLGGMIQEIAKLLNCSEPQAMVLVKERINSITSPEVTQIPRNVPVKRKARPQKPAEPQGFAVLADNPALKELKEKLSQ